MSWSRKTQRKPRNSVWRFRPDKPWKQSRERKVAVSWHRGACGRLCRGSDRGRERTPEENRNKSGAQWPDWSSGQFREKRSRSRGTEARAAVYAGEAVAGAKGS